jgi:flagellar biogenesis protein FliO
VILSLSCYRRTVASLLGACVLASTGAWAQGSAPSAPQATPATASAEGPAPTEATRPQKSPRDAAMEELSGKPTAETLEADRGFGSQYFRMVLMLGVVLGLAYLVLNVGLRRLMKLQRPTGPGAELVTVVARIPVEPKRAVLLMRAAGEYLLVGSSEMGLQLLSKLDGPEVERVLKANADAGGTGALSPFLQKLLARKGGGPPPPSA